MKISCPSCEAKYSIGDDKVQSRLAKIRCRKCGVDIVIDGRVQPPTVSVGDATSAASTTAAAEAAPAPAAQAAIATSGQSYTIDFGESDQRQMTLEEVVTAYNAGLITPETFVWSDGMTDWTPLGQVSEIVGALNAPATAAAAAVEPPPASAAQPPASSVPRPSAAKAARTQGRGADLFSGLANAGSEEDMSRQQAFSEPAQQPTTGARNESSVLFSLSALTASAKPASSATASMGFSSSAAASKEDSGLIDLKALTAQASEVATASPSTVGLGAPAPLGGLSAGVGGNLGGAPLGGLAAPLGGVSPMAPALGAPALLGDIGYPQKKNRTGLYILGGAAILAIAVVLGLALRPAEAPPAKVEPPAAPLAAPKAEPEPEPIKPAESEAKPPATGEAPAASASVAPPKPAVAGGGRARTGGGGTKKPPTSGGDKPSTGGGDAPAPPPKKPAAPANKCGCAPGDLGCAMRCAAKG